MIHSFVFIIPHNRTVSAWEPISVEKGAGGGCVPLSGGRRGECPQGLTPRDLVSHEGHRASVLTPVSSSWWKKYNWTKGFPLPPPPQGRPSAQTLTQFALRSQVSGDRRKRIPAGYLEILTWRPFLKQAFHLLRVLSSWKFPHSLFPSLTWASPG